MKDNCFICNDEVEIEGKLCCIGDDCGCHGNEIQANEDEYVVCESCLDFIGLLEDKDFTVIKDGKEFDINETAELI